MWVGGGWGRGGGGPPPAGAWAHLRDGIHSLTCNVMLRDTRSSRWKEKNQLLTTLPRNVNNTYTIQYSTRLSDTRRTEETTTRRTFRTRARQLMGTGACVSVARGLSTTREERKGRRRRLRMGRMQQRSFWLGMSGSEQPAARHGTLLPFPSTHRMKSSCSLSSTLERVLAGSS